MAHPGGIPQGGGAAREMASAISHRGQGCCGTGGDKANSHCPPPRGIQGRDGNDTGLSNWDWDSDNSRNEIGIELKIRRPLGQGVLDLA